MLPVQPYHEGSYPPGVRFPQFGDDVIGGFLNAHDALAQKRRNMVPFHIGRLQEDGLVPMNMETHTPTPHRDPEGELIDDRPPAPPPLPPRGRGRLRRREPEREGPMIRYGPSEIISEPVPGADQHYIGSETEGAMGASAPSSGLTSAIASGLGNAALSIGAGAGRLAWRGLKAGTSAAIDLAIAGNHGVIPKEDRPQEPWYERPSPPSPSGSPQAPRGGRWFYPGSAKPPPRESRSANPPPHFVDASSWNGTGAHAITISDDEEDEPPGAAAAARRPRRPVRRSDEQLARDTLAGLGPNVGRGMRRRGA